MSLITKVAYLELCPHCGAHGRIVFTDGTKSPIFATKETALDLLELARHQGRANEDDVLAVQDQIVAACMSYSGAILEAYADILNWEADFSGVDVHSEFSPTMPNIVS